MQATVSCPRLAQSPEGDAATDERRAINVIPDVG
jgi:hypothetical protein